MTSTTRTMLCSALLMALAQTAGAASMRYQGQLSLMHQPGRIERAAVLSGQQLMRTRFELGIDRAEQGHIRRAQTTRAPQLRQWVSRVRRIHIGCVQGGDDSVLQCTGRLAGSD